MLPVFLSISYRLSLTTKPTTMHFDRQLLYLAFFFAAERVSALAIDRSRPCAIERDTILDTAPPAASRHGRVLSDAHPSSIESALRGATPRLSYNADPKLETFLRGSTTFLSEATIMRSSTLAAVTPDAQRSHRPHHELRQETGSGRTAVGETASGPTGSGETAVGPTASGETAFGPTASGELSSGPTASGETAFGPTASRIVPVSVSQSSIMASSSGLAQSSGPSQSSNAPSRSSSLPLQSSNPPSQSSNAQSQSSSTLSQSSVLPSQSSVLRSSSSTPPSRSSSSRSLTPTTTPPFHHTTFTTRTTPKPHTTHTTSTPSTSPILSHTTTLTPTGTPGNGTQSSVGSHPISNASVAGIASGLAAGAVLVSLAGLYLYRRKKQGKPLFGPRGSQRSTGSYYPKSAWLYDPQPSRTHSRAGSDSGQNLIPDPRPDTVEMDGGGLASPDMRPSRSSSPLLPPAITVSRDESPGGSPGGSPHRSGGRRSRPMMAIGEEDE